MLLVYTNAGALVGVTKLYITQYFTTTKLHKRISGPTREIPTCYRLHLGSAVLVQPPTQRVTLTVQIWRVLRKT